MTSTANSCSHFRYCSLLLLLLRHTAVVPAPYYLVRAVVVPPSLRYYGSGRSVRKCNDRLDFNIKPTRFLRFRSECYY